MTKSMAQRHWKEQLQDVGVDRLQKRKKMASCWMHITIGFHERYMASGLTINVPRA
jgi:hypothetical protein